MRFFLCSLLSFLPLAALASGSCDEAVSAAVLSDDKTNLYLSLRRGEVRHVNLDTLAVSTLSNAGVGTYYSCIYDLELIGDQKALMVYTSADLGFVLDLENGGGNSMPFAEAWEFDVLGSWRDGDDGFWVVGNQQVDTPATEDWKHLRDLVVCYASARHDNHLDCEGIQTPFWPKRHEPIAVRALKNGWFELAVGVPKSSPSDLLYQEQLVTYLSPTYTHENLSYFNLNPKNLRAGRKPVGRNPWCAKWPGIETCALGAEEKLGELIRFDPLLYVENIEEGMPIEWGMAGDLFDRDWQVSLTAEGRLIYLSRDFSEPRIYNLPPSQDSYYSFEIEGPLPFSSLSGSLDTMILVGEGNGIIHLIDLQTERRRVLACGHAYEPREICAVLYNGPLS